MSRHIPQILWGKTALMGAVFLKSYSVHNGPLNALAAPYPIVLGTETLRPL